MQSALFTPRLNEHYRVAISCFYGLEGSPVKWKGMPLLPGLGGNFGNEYLPLHAERYFGGERGLTMSLMDVWVIDVKMAHHLGELGGLICWTPVDHDPAPPLVKQFFADSGAIPLAMSRFGQEQLREFGALYAPHAVETSVYKRFPQKMVREATGVPEDAFLIGMVAANKGRPSRKGFQQAFEAYRFFRERHENAYLYLHTSMQANWMQGEFLSELLASLEIPAESVLFGDQYRMHFDPHPPGDMAAIYSAMDVLLNPCMGGGFEICQLEAAACGVPSITTDFTACPESAGPTPWKVKGHAFWTGQKSWNIVADIQQLVDALEDAYRMPEKQRRALGKRLRRHAENYDVDRVFKEHMLPALRKAERRLHSRSQHFDVAEVLEMPTPSERKADGPSISVITPWHEHPELAEGYWAALDGEDTHEVIVVDNGSEPAVERAAVRLEENVGFCPANNVGLEKATGEAVLFLNNDVALGLQGWLETIRAALEPGVLVGANMRADQHTAVDGELQPYLDGWCIAGMREDIEALDGWDEDYEEPAYYSDNDLCLRAQQAGMRLVAVNPPLVHLLNRTAGPPVGAVSKATTANRRRYSDKVRAANKEKVAA